MRQTFYTVALLLTSTAALLLSTPSAQADEATRVLQGGGNLCSQLARNPKADPVDLRLARTRLEQLARMKRNADRVRRDSSKRHAAANKAHTKFRALETKLARDCKGKNGPICFITRKRADKAHKKFNRLASEARQADTTLRVVERELAGMTRAVERILRDLQRKYRPRR